VREEKLKTVLSALCDHVRPAVSSFGIDLHSCVLSSRVSQICLSELSFRSEGLAVRANGFNKPYTEWIFRNGRLPEDKKDIAELEKLGGFCVCLGMKGFTDALTEEEREQAGHVVLVAEGKYLLDTSIDQASRPHVGIPLSPFYSEVDESFLNGEKKSHPVFGPGED
jgi:hypothetical protein